MPARTLELVAEPGKPTIILTRVFDAPRRLVFEAFTRPEHVVHWWGLRDHTMTVCEIDLRVGGAWRFVLLDPEGKEFGFRGVYREIVPPEKLVHTYVFEAMPDHEAMVTVTFEEHGGKTTMKETILHKSVEDRDGHLQSGMEPGARETMERLDELLQTLL